MANSSFGNLGALANMAKERRKRNEVEEVPVGKQVLNVHWSEVYSVAQVRKKFNNIEGLAASLEADGQDHPIRVFPKDDKGYRIRKGERRWRAAKLKDLNIDIYVDERESGLAKDIIGQLIENLQREDLDSMEQAEAFRVLRDEAGMSQTEIASSIGKSSAVVSKHLALLTMPEVITDLVESGVVTDLELSGILNKIHDLDENRCAQLCAMAVGEGITRSYANGILRSIRQEQSDVKKQANKPNTGTGLDNLSGTEEREHQNGLNEAGLNESGWDGEGEGGPEGEGGHTGGEKDDAGEVTSGNKIAPQSKTSKKGSATRDEALKNSDGFYERKPENAILLCEFDDGESVRRGVIQLHLLGDTDNDIVLRCTTEGGDEELLAVPAMSVRLLGYRQ